tara:strand:+ start:3057 stop:3902 length:846 start_codon:yes stop_codon:yes gene_type:complete
MIPKFNITYLSLFVAVFLATSCTKENLNTKEELNLKDENQSLLIVEENDIYGKKYKYFHSAEHKKDYEDFMSGNLTVDDILLKYKIGDVGLSNVEWSQLISGELNPVEFDDKIQENNNLVKKGSVNDISFTQMLSEKVRNRSIQKPIYTPVDSQKLNNTAKSSDIDMDPISHIGFEGNELYWFKLQYYLFTTRGSNIHLHNYKKPIVIKHESYPLNMPYSLSHDMSMSHKWFNLGPTWELEATIPDSPWGWSSTNKAHFICAAWFKFFWTETSITVEVTVQ